MSERDAAERAGSFEEVAFGYSSDEALAEANRCLQCKNPTCEQGCPVNIRIKDFIGAIIDGDLPRGVDALKERNALPAVCGRVCPQEEQCEAACVLAKKGEPVAIGRLERYLGRLRPDLRPRAQVRAGDSPAERQALRGSGLRSGRARVRR